MFVPIQDERLFVQTPDTKLFTSTPFYTADEYDLEYPLIVTRKPEMFSINLKNEIMEFMTSCPPGFKAQVQEIIDFGCYYYSDWDSAHMAVLDEFIEVGAADDVRKELTLGLYDAFEAEKELQRQLEMLSEALKKFLTVILGVLAHCDTPAIENFGSCYRLHHIDDLGNAYFKMEIPSRVYDEIENSERINRKLLEPLSDLGMGNTIILTPDGLPGNY